MHGICGLGVAAVNAGNWCADAEKLCALWCNAREVHPSLKILFVCEADVGELGPEDLSFPEFVYHRHYPGWGSRAMGFLVSRSISRFASCRWVGRAGSCRIQGLRVAGSKDLAVLAWHGGHGEALWPSIADVRTLARSCGSWPSVIVGDTNIDYAETIA